MNEIKPHTAELIAKMDAAWAKRLDGSEQTFSIISHNRDFVEAYSKHVEAYNKHLEYLKTAKFWLGA